MGRKTKFHIYSTLDVTATVEQISGPVPSADSSGYPVVDSFVITGDVHILSDENGELVFEPFELAASITLFALIVLMTWPQERILMVLENVQSFRIHIRLSFFALAGITYFASGGLFVAAALGAMCWIVSGTILFRLLEGMERLKSRGRNLSETSRLKHSISNRDSLMMWSRMLLFTSTLFIPILIDIPFLTERYQDIFVPYASGIRAHFMEQFGLC